MSYTAQCQNSTYHIYGIFFHTYLRSCIYIHKCRGCTCISYVSLPYEWLKFLSLTSGLTYACSSVGKLHPQCPLWAALPELLPPHHQGTDQLQWHWLSQCTQGGLFQVQTQWFCWSHCLQLGSCSFFHIQLAVAWQTLCTQGGQCHKFIRLFTYGSPCIQAACTDLVLECFAVCPLLCQRPQWKCTPSLGQGHQSPN